MSEIIIDELLQEASWPGYKEMLRMASENPLMSATTDSRRERITQLGQEYSEKIEKQKKGTGVHPPNQPFQLEYPLDIEPMIGVLKDTYFVTLIHDGAQRPKVSAESLNTFSDTDAVGRSSYRTTQIERNSLGGVSTTRDATTLITNAGIVARDTIRSRGNLQGSLTFVRKTQTDDFYLKMSIDSQGRYGIKFESGEETIEFENNSMNAEECLSGISRFDSDLSDDLAEQLDNPQELLAFLSTLVFDSFGQNDSQILDITVL